MSLMDFLWFSQVKTAQVHQKRNTGKTWFQSHAKQSFNGIDWSRNKQLKWIEATLRFWVHNWRFKGRKRNWTMLTLKLFLRPDFNDDSLTSVIIAEITHLCLERKWPHWPELSKLQAVDRLASIKCIELSILAIYSSIDVLAVGQHCNRMAKL